ncbi:hypothetical protein PC116_g14946 [Phytophthora cactorum]|uniref:Uncharacterized protein n=1 Tax=Phytophthora cactorum TaxID=29920 RepID=A0A8T1FLR3_9STRA|nr:hypothetical protein PC112_g11933 [Phytophthora cactorum]KAG2825664.1 hypothetical protein PC111_g9277 [Phytophthora cactorum]KAG2856260.1 hypothetical protein PC113_g11726 [Phytophthora cactorum]KAG2892383.1 hypothetical protein PC117_g24021 [Phytophthora cactorum]KAG2903570.1 hypothetical protein PC114_g12206 [Phytophthora cactorum]
MDMNNVWGQSDPASVDMDTCNDFEEQCEHKNRRMEFLSRTPPFAGDQTGSNSGDGACIGGSTTVFRL